MKKLGIIGGSGPLASVLLYDLIIKEIAHLKKKMPEIIILNYPFTNEPEEVWKSDKILVDKMLYCIDILTKCHVDLAVIACNTLHYYLRLLPPINLDFLLLPHLVLEEATKRKISSVLILGSGNTCDYGLYKHPNIEIFYPPPAEQKTINDIIGRLIQCDVRKEDSKTLSEIISHLEKTMNFKAIVLGCTDFPALHRQFPLEYGGIILDSIGIPARVIANSL